MTTKYVVVDLDEGGLFAQATTVEQSSGADSANAVPSLNGAGVLDPSLLNAALSGPNKVLLAGPDGRLSLDALPTGAGIESAEVVTTEDIGPGQCVNVYDDSGQARLRLACAATGRPADGFCVDAFTQGQVARVYFEGINGQATGAVAGRTFLSDTPGCYTMTPPTDSGRLLQILGTAYGPNTMYFKPERPVRLA
jgi:hypothetical protein